MKGTSLLTLYVAIIGLGTLAGILFNVLINKRLIFRILGIIITLVTGTFACLVVLFPYFFFSSYNNLFIKLSLTAVLLIIIYVSARMIVNACSSVRNREKAEDKKDVHKAEPAVSEIAIADHALMNKVKSIISADKTPAKSLTQKVSVKLDDASLKLAVKEIKEIIPGLKSAESDAGVYNGQPDKPSFGQALKDADDKILADSQYAKNKAPDDKAVAAASVSEKKTDMKEPAVKQDNIEPTVKPGKAAGKKAEAAPESKLGIQYEEPADTDKKAEEKIVKSGTIESVLGIQYEQPEEEAAGGEAVQAVVETISEPQNTQPVEQAAAVAEEAGQAAVESEPDTQVAQTAEATEMPGEKDEAVTAAKDRQKADPDSAKFVMIISKARELMGQEKYVYAAELIQMCYDRSEDVAVKKQADILMIECLALSDRKSEAQEKWIEFLNKKYILDEADKNKLKQVMRSLQG